MTKLWQTFFVGVVFILPIVVVVWSIRIDALEDGLNNQVHRGGGFSVTTTPTTTSQYVHINNDDPPLDVTHLTTAALARSERDLSKIDGTTATGSSTSNSINPYTSGCLHAKELVSHLRVCNSEDPVEASASGICRLPGVDYMEIRIFSDNWESITFEAWILQIILSELLDVPTTIEAGSYEGSLNFFHPDAPMEYGIPLSDNEALKLAHGIGDCRNANKHSPDNYEACAHFDPERWTGAY
jgi:hypothetical protein